ncbi:hypothetical protein ACFPRL_20580 [Pseudoclavibacter helvolus]
MIERAHDSLAGQPTPPACRQTRIIPGSGARHWHPVCLGSHENCAARSPAKCCIRFNNDARVRANRTSGTQVRSTRFAPVRPRPAAISAQAARFETRPFETLARVVARPARKPAVPRHARDE